MTPRRFFFRSLLFFLPLFVLVVGFEAALWRIGESVPVEIVLQRQAVQPDTIWLRRLFGQSFYSYKWAGQTARSPRIAAIGSSRVMQFRAEMLGTRDFFNGGGMVHSLEDLEGWEKQLPVQNSPRVIFLGIDHWWLNANRHDTATNPQNFARAIEFDDARDWHAHWQILQELSRSAQTRSLFRRALAATRLGDKKRSLGVRALLSGRGFRGDGSLNYDYKPLPDWRFYDRASITIEERIREKKQKFESGSLSRARLQRLERVLTRLQKRGILVCVFAPPLVSHASRLLQNSPSQRDLWNDYRRELPLVCARLKIPYCDASSPTNFGLDDRAMFDGVHAAETLHLHILRVWLRDSRIQEALPKAQERIETLLRAPKTDVWYPDYASTVDIDRTPKAEGGRLR